MLALAERFQAGRLSARDAQRIIGAGLRGAGHDIADDAVARMQADGAAAGFVDIVARLLAATFGARVTPPPAPPSPLGGRVGGGGNVTGASASTPAPASTEGRDPPAPFPGTT
jgi:hypothetical protein